MKCEWGHEWGRWFQGVDAEALIANTHEIAISTGSACKSGPIEPSHVLLAIRFDQRGSL